MLFMSEGIFVSKELHTIKYISNDRRGLPDFSGGGIHPIDYYKYCRSKNSGNILVELNMNAQIHLYFIGQVADTWNLEDFLEFHVNRGGSRNDGETVWVSNLKLIQGFGLSDEITRAATNLTHCVIEDPKAVQPPVHVYHSKHFALFLTTLIYKTLVSDA